MQKKKSPELSSCTVHANGIRCLLDFRGVPNDMVFMPQRYSNVRNLSPEEKNRPFFVRSKLSV